ncbi:ankyrin repeat-containing protein [Striga asiatica]|uniref:Ankyrin repeat-containing protein n=1 Tax=Striga asiatica TaxID=4170 RepID=A0A5A7RIG2_STRAF|nr:ankyrin repeat-containing protein [Striga asiatica]
MASTSSSAAQPSPQPVTACQCSCSSAVNAANFISAKLRREPPGNYKSWKEQMLCLIESQGFLGFVDGEEISPPKKADGGQSEHAAWRRRDRLVKGWILGALSDEVVETVLGFSTAREVWTKLEKEFGVSKQVPAPPPPPPAAAKQDRDWHDYLPLYRAALRGDWATAKAILDGDPDAARARVAFTLETSLHIAVGTGKAIPFVAKLVDLMPDEHLALKDELGFNALHVAALAGNTEAARILVSRLPDLLYVQSNTGSFPIHKAAMSAHKETLRFLISQTKDDVNPSPYFGDKGVMLLIDVIDADFFDVALELAEKYPHLAQEQLSSGNSALKRLALKDSAFSSGDRLKSWERLLYAGFQLVLRSEIQNPAPNSGDIEDQTCSTLFCRGKYNFPALMIISSACYLWFKSWDRVIQNLHSNLSDVIKQLVPHVKRIHDKKMMHQQALKLLKCLCKNMESLKYKEASMIYRDAVLTAARLGIHEVVEAIVATFPASIYSQHDEAKQFMFHLAVHNRCERVFNLIYQTSDNKHHYLDLLDSSGNSLLHLAASLAPSHKLNAVSGAALQMQREIQWFKEVEKFVHPYSRERPNHAGKTPKMVFTEEHKTLKSEGEKWMKDTANSCTIAAALIATVVFAAAITVPGGSEPTGHPIFHTRRAFLVFAVSDAISLFTSTTSLLMFLSVLTSRYAEEDFLYALPTRLCIGLVALFLSIFFMMAAFSTTVFLVFGRSKAWVWGPVLGLACLPVTSFVLLQFPLMVDVVWSTYGRGIFGKQSDSPFY